ncbi:MAG: YtxH domain-containing protein [Maribacter sp.]
MSNDSGSVLLALLTGAAIGAGVGILYAPDKGTKTRKKIKKKALEAKDEIATRVAQATEELTKTAESKKIDFEQKLEETISNMSYKADDIILGLEGKLAELKKKNAQLQK